MSIRKLFAILIAVAVLFAPVLSPVGGASAAVPDHHGQMIEGGHCQQPPFDTGGGHDKAPEKSCCISMCMGVAVTPPALAQELTPAQDAAVSLTPSLRVAYLGDIATPPPKFA